MRWLLLIALAGCVGVPVDTIPEAPDVVPALVFGEPLLVAAGGDAEVSLLVHEETVLVCSHGGFVRPSPLWASTDGGATFDYIDPQPNPVVSGDCDLAIGPAGEWAIVYDTIASATIGVSRDQGASWDLNYASALPIAVDRPWIVWGDDLYMTYSDVMAAEPALQMFARSTDGGRTFTEHTPINRAEPPDKIQAVIGKMVVHEDTIRVPLARGNLQGGGLISIDHAISDDLGATWRIEPVYGPYDPPGLLLPTLTRTDSAWIQVVPMANGSVADLAIIRSTDGTTWSDPEVVAPDVDLPGVAGPWVDAIGERITLAWIEETDAGWAAASVQVDDVPSAKVYMAPPVDIDQGIGHEFIMVDHFPDGRAVVAWLMNTGPECDPAPNAAEDRGSQCVYVSVQDLASPGAP